MTFVINKLKSKSTVSGMQIFLSFAAMGLFSTQNTVANDAALAAVDQALAPFISASEISGAVTIVATPDKFVHVSAAGLADVSSQRLMRRDTVFWIASMTKPVTGVAILMLADDGKLSLDDLASKHIPELASLKTPAGQPANVTIRHLLTHTSGMGEFSSVDEARGAKTLADAVAVYATKPMQFAPGEKWSYCQSSINTAGRIVEIASGMSLPEFLETRLFRPLGMSDTTFYLSNEQAARLATPYNTKNGQLDPTENFILNGMKATDRDRFPAANGGLFSTGPDYARFCQMLLNGGQLSGKRYLSDAAWKQLTSIHTGELTTGFTPGNGWGIGCCVVRSPQGITAIMSPGSFGHGGAYGTQAWIDPTKKVVYVLMVQRANFPNADASDVRRAFQEAANKSLNAAAVSAK